MMSYTARSRQPSVFGLTCRSIFLLLLVLTGCGGLETPTAKTNPTQERGQNALMPTQELSSSGYPVVWLTQVDANKQLYSPPVAVGVPIPLDQITKDQPLLDTAGEEVTFKGQRTVLLLGISDCPACDDQLPLVRTWASELSNVQIVYAVRGPDLATKIEALKQIPNIRVIDDSSRQLAAGLQGRAGPTTFLIDEQGIVRWRMTAFRAWNGAILDTAVRHFVAGEPLDSSYYETNYSFPGTLPSFALTDETGQDVALTDVLIGRPSLVLLLDSNCPECDEVVAKVLTLLDQRADPDLELILVLDTLSEAELERGQQYVTTFQLDESTHGFVNQTDDPSHTIAVLQDQIQQHTITTQLLLDPESRLATFWTVPSTPFAVLINKQGQLEDFLPFFWFSETEDGARTVQPSIDVLSRLLDTLVK